MRLSCTKHLKPHGYIVQEEKQLQVSIYQGALQSDGGPELQVFHHNDTPTKLPTWGRHKRPLAMHHMGSITRQWGNMSRDLWEIGQHRQALRNLLYSVYG